MLVGHVAVGLAAKRITPRVSLGTTVLAALLPDLLWCVFLLTGIELVELKPGLGAVNYLEAVDIAFSHSLLMDAVWGAILAAAYFITHVTAAGPGCYGGRRRHVDSCRHLLRTRNAAWEPAGHIRVLDRRSPPDAGVARQHYRTAASQRSSNGHEQLNLFLADCGLGVLDEPA